MVNFGMRRTGLVPGTESERDPQQVQLAIESVRALLPIVETVQPDQAAKIREALSQLQLAYVRIGGAAAPPADAPGPVPGADEPGVAPGPSAAAPGPSEGAPRAGEAAAPQPAPPEEPVKPGEPGPAQRSGRLWVPGSR